jgi:membrane dipeptidase
LRLIDLHTDWLLQYAGETTVFDPTLYPGVSERLGQSAGYLQSTSAAILSCFRRECDWATQADPWAALDALIVRIESEFPGRVLRDPADLVRWADDADGLAWALIGIEGFDYLIRSDADLARLGQLIRRGVRLFQPSYTAHGLLAGSSASGDIRGLTELGVRFLETLASHADPERGPRPMLDLAHLNPRSMADILTWLEADPERTERLLPVYSHGGLRRFDFDHPRALTLENLARLRALGGVVGLGVTPPFIANAGQLRASIEAAAELPFLGRPGFEGIAIGTDFLGIDATLPGLANAQEVMAYVQSTFPPEAVLAILHTNARRLIERAIGG